MSNNRDLGFLICLFSKNTIKCIKYLMRKERWENSRKELNYSTCQRGNNYVLLRITEPLVKGIKVKVPGSSDGKESAYNTGDPGSIPGSGIFPEKGNGNPLQYSCLENPMGRGAWQSTGHGVTKSWVWLTNTSNTQRVYYAWHLKAMWSSGKFFTLC